MSEIAREEVKVANEEVKEEEKKLYTPEEARRIMGWSKNMIYDVLANDETFPAFRMKGSVRWFINADKLQSWIDEQTKR